MKNRMWFFGIVASIALMLATLIVGCSTVQPTIRVFGGQSELRQLVGEWAGEYYSETTGRIGTILFSLKAGADSAYGSIMMIAPKTELQNHALLQNEGPTITWRPVQTLIISFVVVDGNRVRGTLEPYTDPNCHCVVTTLFEGILTEDVMEGTYSSTGSSLGLITNGTWKVVRKSGTQDIARDSRTLPLFIEA